VDGAGQVQKFEALLRAFTFGRGAGIRAWAIYQDIGQMQRHFGAPALQSFLGSAQLRQFFGVRDFETAKMVSSMLGQETLEFDDTLQQNQAQMRRKEMSKSILYGSDPFEAANEFRHFTQASTHRSKTFRPLMSADEILSMPEDKQILFISGKNLPPILGNKYPYFSRQAQGEMEGKYLPNPYHPPIDRLRVPAWHGHKWLRVITEPIPDSFQNFPQYCNGYWTYAEGYQPSTN
ncbi:MAG: TraM recognition domain-containing protein, partial [Devosiaceae bacterium]|nr:TraM recognition domain-containing protein [Devosiaceae bacterium]